MSPIKVVFMGTPTFAVPSLKALMEDDRFEVTLVITQPDRPVGRKQVVTMPPVKEVAQAAGIPVFQPANVKKEWEAYVKEHALTRPDFLIVVAYGQLLSQELLDWPTIAPVNVHGSLLPAYRGASPMQEALLRGDNKTGVTLQRMVKELDAGPILAQRPVGMDTDETMETLGTKLSGLGAALIIDTLTAPLRETPQDEKKATFCRKLTRADGMCDPSTMTAGEINRKVHALTPWPGVTIGELKILESSLSASEDSAALDCVHGSTLHLVRVQPPGKKPMSGQEWQRGKR